MLADSLRLGIAISVGIQLFLQVELSVEQVVNLKPNQLFASSIRHSTAISELAPHAEALLDLAPLN